jgi:hypothetical protein
MASNDIRRSTAMTEIDRRIARTRRVWLTCRVADGLARLILFMAVGVLLLLVVAQISLPGVVWLGYVVALVGGSVAIGLTRVAAPLRHTMSREAIARHIERANPNLDNRIINAVQLGDAQFDDSLAQSMVDAQVEQTAEAVRERLTGPDHESRALRRYGAPALAALALLVGVLVVAPEQARMAWQRVSRPYESVRTMALTQLVVSPGDTECLQGAALRIQARALQVLPASARIVWKVDGQDTATEDMPFEANAFAHTFPNVQKDFRYSVIAGDGRSEEFRVTVRQRPAVSEIDQTLEYPQYVGLPLQHLLGTSGDIAAPPGTTVALTIRTGRPVASGVIELTGHAPAPERIPMQIDADGALHAALKVTVDATYGITVTDASGFTNVPLVRRIHAGDAPPRVAVSEPSRDVTLRPDATLHVVAAAEDDYHLRTLQLIVVGKSRAGKRWPSSGNRRAARCEADLDVAALGLKIGDELAYYVEAGDGRLDGGVTRSRVYRARIGEAAAATPAPEVQDPDKKSDDLQAVIAKLMAEEAKNEEAAEQEELLEESREKAEKAVKKLQEFRKDQEKIIELSKQLAEKEPDDFTEQDQQDLKEIADTEKEWAKIFQELATDLSKLPPQDHSLAGQAKELLEVFSEVNAAAEEAEREAIELAVPHEQAGAELAESIETNLEKWLEEAKDNKAWKMEDPIEDYETPIVELPDELQDLIGDLIEAEEDMEEQFDDATSGWMDSLDKGAGWGTTDGPISNMSAKGVTGNVLPNTNEVGGRSGEGRTGKSSGQFVEEEATGKGGRDTPSRLTADPFEAGVVKDSAPEATTATTGGGKMSGQGAEGFQGPVPPPVQEALKRMANQQQGLIDKARALDYGLKKYNHPRGELPRTIDIMEKLKTSLEKGEIATFQKYHKTVLVDLRKVKSAGELQKLLSRSTSRPLPKELRDMIASPDDEQVPEQYRALVRDYFRSLSVEGGR